MSHKIKCHIHGAEYARAEKRSLLRRLLDWIERNIIEPLGRAHGDNPFFMGS